ncbi:hypothetical protein [Nocardia sp. NBC_00511]|uniref:hypothetical protein n=1 Tax=Nocardia sp. NBC_00511 TaxID=2903591 RepID=UPI0030E44FD5
MPEKFGGKLFYSAEESEQLGLVPSDEELAAADRMFEEFENRRRTAPPAPDGTTPGFGGRFSNDHEGTEFEGWTRDPVTRQWYDQNGRLVPDQGPDNSAEQQ